MPAFFICFIVFVIWFHVKSNQENKSKDTWDKSFWEREHEADFAPKKDISDIEYISLQTDLLPFNDSPDDEEKELQEKILELTDAKLLNLSGMTNTDIKLQYGAFPDRPYDSKAIWGDDKKISNILSKTSFGE